MLASVKLFQILSLHLGVGGGGGGVRSNSDELAKYSSVLPSSWTVCTVLVSAFRTQGTRGLIFRGKGGTYSASLSYVDAYLHEFVGV